MQTTIDNAGRMVIPKSIRERLGIVPGSRVDLHEDGAGLRLDVVTTDNLVEVDGYLLVDVDPGLSEEQMRELRLADQA